MSGAEQNDAIELPLDAASVAGFLRFSSEEMVTPADGPVTIPLRDLKSGGQIIFDRRGPSAVRTAPATDTAAS